MSALPGTTCLLTESEDEVTPLLFARPIRREPDARLTDPGDDAARAERARQAGRPATTCTVCGAPTSERFTRRSKSGKTFCQPCADRTVAAYYARHPEARPRPARAARERTGISYLQERERYEVRYHGGHGRWQIADTQTRRWTAQSLATEPEARTAAARMNATWRAQVASERGITAHS